MTAERIFLTQVHLPQQNASRTPSRTDAPSALERVRQAANKGFDGELW
jgi:hypothetical protein